MGGYRLYVLYPSSAWLARRCRIRKALILSIHLTYKVFNMDATYVKKNSVLFLRKDMRPNFEIKGCKFYIV
jgi:hypothetical protein